MPTALGQLPLTHVGLEQARKQGEVRWRKHRQAHLASALHTCPRRAQSTCTKMQPHQCGFALVGLHRLLLRFGILHPHTKQTSLQACTVPHLHAQARMHLLLARTHTRATKSSRMLKHKPKDTCACTQTHACTHTSTHAHAHAGLHASIRARTRPPARQALFVRVSPK